MAESVIQNGQTCLEKRGMDERHREIVRSEYNINDQYGVTHSNALSNGDVKGKGTGGSHTHWLPDCTKPRDFIDYSNFDTVNGGGLYDIEGRNGVGGRKKALVSSLYNENFQYGAKLVNTAENIAEGQVYLNY